MHASSRCCCRSSSNREQALSVSLTSPQLFFRAQHPTTPDQLSSFLRNRLKQENDAAVRHLSSVRALYRLSLASGGGGAAIAGVAGGGIIPDGTTAAAAAADPHPHLTALATVLGEGSKLMARLAESSLGQGVEEPVARLLHEDSKSQVRKCFVLEYAWDAESRGALEVRSGRVEGYHL